MAPLLIQFTKKPDGSHILRCVRPDSTATWQRRKESFSALHDLTHYAVETTLRLRRGFYGLLLSGWNVTDFGTPWPRGPIPEDAAYEAALAERVTGLFDTTESTGIPLTADVLNELLAASLAQQGMNLDRPVSNQEIARIRETREALFQRWFGLPPGETLALRFAPADERVP